VVPTYTSQPLQVSFEVILLLNMHAVYLRSRETAMFVKKCKLGSITVG